jgi:alkylhydroperoxidase family enzyme
MRALRTPGRREPLGPAMRSGPFQYLVDALEPLPLAGVLWRMLDGAFAAPGLSPRARALVFAVVARGLGCDVCEREALRLVAAEGFPAAEVEPALAHLAAPAFDPVERVIVPFTRETIRYSEPAPLQRRARGVLAQVGPAAFGEFVGTAALANMLARLSFLAQLA